MNHINIFKLYQNLSESDESWIWIVEYKSWLKLLKMPIIFIKSAPKTTMKQDNPLKRFGEPLQVIWNTMVQENPLKKW
jgi:hypothetical protein